MTTGDEIRANIEAAGARWRAAQATHPAQPYMRHAYLLPPLSEFTGGLDWYVRVLTLFETVWADENNRDLFIWPDPDMAERRRNAETLMGFESARRGSRRAAGDGRDRAYALGALTSEAAAVAATTTCRNNRLFAAACGLGKFVNAGHLSRDEVQDKLFDAACACGYVRSDGAHATRATITSGLDTTERSGETRHAPT
jgi:hypothetical protein